MKRPRAALKVAAVACSVVLAAGLVSYRAGAFDWARETPAPAENPPEPAPAGEPTATVTPESGAFISGSKSGIFIVPPGNPSPSGGSAAASPTPSFQPVQPTLIGGSKSIAPLIPPSPPARPAGQSPPAQSASPPK